MAKGLAMQGIILDKDETLREINSNLIEIENANDVQDGDAELITIIKCFLLVFQTLEEIKEVLSE